MSNTQEVKLEPVRDYHYFGSCRLCGCHQTFMVNLVDLNRWLNLVDLNRWHVGGVLIQDAMPYLSAGEREFLKTEICETCFDAMFADCE